ncbi:MAG: DNA mismatch repair endonuclease MutL [Bacteroidaceae bacterium]|nr:DNA mismatch repair endonuclease MutL [Bacteroidaceae bacterium]
MDIIHLLPDSVANQIAAGEVIQRPASVIKELVENAVDAGAGNIEVHVRDAGRTAIQVIDDGKGMSETDARLAFERHATSKITRAEDLFTLRTMGFRGEALPSIVAVAQVTLQTRTHDAELGTRLEIEGGRVLSQEPCVCAVGANFEVRNLFFNIPARRKFLKSNHTELNNIMQEFERIALVNPSVGFSLFSDGTQSIRLMSTNLRRRIIDIFGKKVGEDLVAVDVETSLVRIEGFVGRPETSRKKGAHQYFFVNGRYMRHPYFAKAVTEAFSGLVPEGEQVPYFLYFSIDPANIDVNISPTKTEVKFENEHAIWQIILAGIRESLAKFSAVPTIDFDCASPTDIPVMEKSSGNVAPPEINIDKSYNPFLRSGNSSVSYNPTSGRARSSSKDWNVFYEQLAQDASSLSVGQESIFPEENYAPSDSAGLHFQYRGQYIVSATKTGLMLVDQHRAHVRILYDKYMAMMERRDNATQGLLFPELLSLPPSDAQILETISEDIRCLGFDISSLGGGSFSINGLPAGIDGLVPQTLIGNMVDAVREGGQADLSAYRHRIALSLASAAAIVVGQVLSMAEIDVLLADLMKSSNPNITPNGKAIIALLKPESIDAMFAKV